MNLIELFMGDIVDRTLSLIGVNNPHKNTINVVMNSKTATFIEDMIVAAYKIGEEFTIWKDIVIVRNEEFYDGEYEVYIS